MALQQQSTFRQCVANLLLPIYISTVFEFRYGTMSSSGVINFLTL